MRKPLVDNSSINRYLGSFRISVPYLENSLRNATSNSCDIDQFGQKI